MNTYTYKQTTAMYQKPTIMLSVDFGIETCDYECVKLTKCSILGQPRDFNVVVQHKVTLDYQTFGHSTYTVHIHMCTHIATLYYYCYVHIHYLCRNCYMYKQL